MNKKPTLEDIEKMDTTQLRNLLDGLQVEFPRGLRLPELQALARAQLQAAARPAK